MFINNINNMDDMNNIKNEKKVTEGYLEIILGSMFSGKTSRLLDIYNKYTFCNIPTIVLNYIEDKRYGNKEDDKLYTHDQNTIPCLSISKLLSINKSMLNKPDVILINEGQFFPDLYEFVIEMVEKYKKKVYICGLDGDFKRQQFGTLINLIPFCDEIIKLKSLCSICKNGKKGIFTHRKTNEEQQKVIGSDSYIPLCRMCYEKNNS